MAKFKIGDIVVPIDTPSNDYEITNHKNKYVGKVVEILDNGEIRLETVDISSSFDSTYFSGKDLYTDYVVNENFFALKSEENNKNHKEKEIMKKETTNTINTNALQSVIDLIGKYSIKKDGTESTPREIIAVQIYVAKDGLKSQRAYRTMDEYANIDELLVFDLPKLEPEIKIIEVPTVFMEEEVKFEDTKPKTAIKEEKSTTCTDTDVDWSKFKKSKKLSIADKLEFYKLYKSGMFTPMYIAEKCGYESVACVWTRMWSIKKELGL